ncbi:MAG: DUF4398 domain-containing protein [Myxococcaceae bacterium]
MPLRCLALGALGMLVGCGPIRTASHLVDAEIQLSAARTAGAEQRAPYDWTAASLYFERAKEEEGVAQYGQATIYAEKALHHAARARERAVSQARQGDGAP